MEVIEVNYFTEGKNRFYRLSTHNRRSIRDIAVEGDSLGKFYRFLFLQLRDFYPESEVSLEFVGDSDNIPRDKRDALMDLVVYHNSGIKK